MNATTAAPHARTSRSRPRLAARERDPDRRRPRRAGGAVWIAAERVRQPSRRGSASRGSRSSSPRVPNRWCSASSSAAPRLSICSGRSAARRSCARRRPARGRRTGGSSASATAAKIPRQTSAFPPAPPLPRRARPRAGGAAPDRASPRTPSAEHAVPSRCRPATSAASAPAVSAAGQRSNRVRMTGPSEQRRERGEAERRGQPRRPSPEARRARAAISATQPRRRRRPSATRSVLVRLVRRVAERGDGEERAATPADTRGRSRGTAPARRRSRRRSAGRPACR